MLLLYERALTEFYLPGNRVHARLTFTVIIINIYSFVDNTFFPRRVRDFFLSTRVKNQNFGDKKKLVILKKNT